MHHANRRVVKVGRGLDITLYRDIGEALSSGGHLTALRRTRVGDVRIEDCQSVEQAIEMIQTSSVSYPEWYEGRKIDEATDEDVKENE